MSVTIESLRERGATHIKAAREIVERAQAEGRSDLTGHEACEVENHLSAAKTLGKQAQGKERVDSVMRLSSVDDVHDYESTGTKSKGFDAEASKGLIAAVKTRSSYRFELPAKAALTSTVLPTSGAGVAPGLYPNAPCPSF